MEFYMKKITNILLIFCMIINVFVATYNINIFAVTYNPLAIVLSLFNILIFFWALNQLNSRTY